MTPPLRRRWLDDKPGLVSEVLKNAVDYWQNATEHDREWIRIKPWSNNPHEFFFQTYMRFLHLLRAADLKPCSRVLDVGVGTGWTSEIMARLGHSVVAVEPSPECIDIAKNRAFAWNLSANEGQPLDLTFHVGDITTFTAEPHSFDAVIFYDCLHHIDDEVALFANLRRWLRQEGVLAVSEGIPPEPGSQVEQESFQQMRDYGVLENPFYPEYLDYLLAANGFPVVRRLVPIIREVGRGEIEWATFRDYIHEYEQLNFIVATRMDLPGTPTTEAKSISAAFRLLARRNTASTQEFDIEIRNTGQESWMPGGKSMTGEINLGVFLCETKDEWNEGPRRFPLANWLHPGETTTITITLDSARLANAKRLRAQLVCEQRFWGHDIGLVPLEIAL